MFEYSPKNKFKNYYYYLIFLNMGVGTHLDK
jgi:hypothetical protein